MTDTPLKPAEGFKVFRYAGFDDVWGLRPTDSEGRDKEAFFASERAAVRASHAIAAWNTRVPDPVAEKLAEALEWIFEIADKEFEQDTKLLARGARTLKRIADRAETALSQYRNGGEDG